MEVNKTRQVVLHYCFAVLKRVKKAFSPLFWWLVSPRKVRQQRLDFLVIGAQKAGTSALDQYLRLHLGLSLPDGCKELHYFDNENMMKRPRWYREAVYHHNFRNRGSGVLLGEVTPRYLFCEEYAKRIYSYNPDIKIIVSLRNPVFRAYSQWNMECQRGSESRSFMSIFLEEKNKDIGEIPQERAYFQRGLYAKQINFFLKYFSKDQMLVIRQEDLKKDPVKTLKEVSEFLNIDSFPFVSPKSVHERDYIEHLDEASLRKVKSYFLEDIEELEVMLRWDLSEWK